MLLLNIVTITFYPNIHRVTFPALFRFYILGSELNDSLFVVLAALFLLSTMSKGLTRLSFILGPITLFAISFYTNTGSGVRVAVLIALAELFYALYRKKSTLNIPLMSIVILFLFLIIETCSIIFWSSLAFGPILVSTIFDRIANLSLQLFYTVGLISPIVFLLTIFSFLLKPILSSEIVLSIARKVRSKIATQLQLERLLYFDLPRPSFLSPPPSILSFLTSWKTIFLSSIIFSWIFVIFANVPALNPDGRFLGTDLPYYYGWVSNLSKSSTILQVLMSAFSTTVNGDRPLTLLILYALSQLLNVSLNELLKFVGGLISSLLALSIFVFVKYTTQNHKLASLSALFSTLSFTFTIGMYAGFLSNWLALVTSYLALMAIIQYWRIGSKFWFSIVMIFTICTLLIHIYAWIHLMLAMAAFLLLSVVMQKFGKVDSNSRTRLIILVLVFSANVGIDLAKSSLLGSVSGISENFEIATTAISEKEFEHRWQNLQYAFRFYLGGLFTNLVPLVLALIWCIRASYKKTFDRMILSYIIVGSALVILGNYVVQVRVLYDMPFPLVSSFVIYGLVEGPHKEKKAIHQFLALVIIIHFFNYVFRSLANLYLIAPH